FNQKSPKRHVGTCGITFWTAPTQESNSSEASMTNRRKGIPVPLQMIAGLVLGVLFGVFVPAFAGKLSFLSTIFAHAIKMVVMPLILLSVTVGTFRAAAQRGHLGRTAALSVVFFVV